MTQAIGTQSGSIFLGGQWRAESGFRPAVQGGEHRVGPGDDLASLARAYGVDAGAIVAANSHLIVDPELPLVEGDLLHIPQGDLSHIPQADLRADAGQPVFEFASGRASPRSSHYKETITFPRYGHDGPRPPRELKAIVDSLNGYMRDHHASLGNRNRIVHVRGPDIGEEISFPAKRGIRMVDGNGEFRGTLAADAVKINYGQRKTITYTYADGHQRTETYVYAFATKINAPGHDHPMGASGWIPLSGLKDSTAKRHYAADLRDVVAHGPRGGDAPQRYVVTGGSDKLDLYGDLKVNPGNDGSGVSRKENLKATDYLRRPGDVVNLLYSLPGHGGAANDTFKSGAEFVPAAGVPRVRIPLYLPKNPTAQERSDWRNNDIPHYMEFVYGRVGERYGWIAADALTPKGAG